MRAKRRERKPRLTDEDLALWRHATRADERLPEREDAPADDAPPPEVKPKRRPVEPPPVPGRPAGLDKRSAQRLRRGQTPVEARLDLHGLTQAEAHRALNAFLAAAQAAGKRCALVITGKGGEGVLKRMVPLWLAEAPNRPRVLAIEPAQPRHGGEGALYVLLRKAR
jgi:DNA-nicking Smr family endonuclease